MLRSAGAVGSAARDASAPTEGGEGREHIVAASPKCLRSGRESDASGQKRNSSSVCLGFRVYRIMDSPSLLLPVAGVLNFCQ